MSITYLQEPNAYKEIADKWWLGQTVTLEFYTRLYYLYYEAWFSLDRNPIFCDVYLTDEAHHPVGTPVASAKSWLADWEKHGVRDRQRFLFWGFPMEAGVEYFFLIHDETVTLHINTRIYIREGDSIYPDGKLYYSENSGETWTEFPNDDIVFALTGKTEVLPPPPKPPPDIPAPPPPAPIKNFAILDIEYTPTATGLEIVVTTNVPCHLYCYWTAHEPQKHLIPILTRGIELHTQLKMCFVDWTENEQEEPLDTLTHTFIKEPWAECETRWLTFRAKVMNEWVKSVGPIFKKHRVAPPYGPPVTVRYYTDKHPEIWSVDGSVSRLVGNTTWADLRNGPGTAADSSSGICTSAFYSGDNPGEWIYIYRTINLFDTRLLPAGCLINSASVFFKTHSLRNDLPTSPAYNIFTSNPASNNDLVPADYQVLGSDRLSTDVPYADLVVGAYTEYPLNAAGLTAITKAGITKLGLREVNYDLANIEPPWGPENDYTWYNFWSAEAILTNIPYLEVTYREQL